MGVPQNWMVYKGKSHWNGWFGCTPISGNLRMNSINESRPPLIKTLPPMWAREMNRSPTNSACSCSTAAMRSASGSNPQPITGTLATKLMDHLDNLNATTVWTEIHLKDFTRLSDFRLTPFDTPRAPLSRLRNRRATCRGPGSSRRHGLPGQLRGAAGAGGGRGGVPDVCPPAPRRRSVLSFLGGKRKPKTRGDHQFWQMDFDGYWVKLVE